MPDTTSPPPPVPPKRPVPPQIDPKKFMGGENLERLKSMLKDVEGFAETVKEKGKKLEETLDKFDGFVQKFGETVEHARKVFQLNEILLKKMLDNVKEEVGQILEDSNGRKP